MSSAMTLRLFMTADTVGGIWTYALNLAQGLEAHGVATTLATLGPPPSADQLLAAAGVARLRLVVTDLPLEWQADRAKLAASARRLAAIARRRGAEIVHLNSPALAALADFGAPMLGVCHSCVATWWSSCEAGALPADFRWRTELLAQGYAACDRLVAPSAAFAAATLRHYGVSVAVVHNGGAVTAYVDEPALAGERFVLTAGRLWDAGKNLATLDRAAAMLEAPIYAAGAQALPRGQPAEYAHTRMLGRLGATELGGWMRRAPVFASLALYEPFGLCVLEAAQHGCALVLSDIPSFCELWAGAAWFVPATDAAQAGRALRALLDDPGRARELAAAARARSRRYSVDAMAGQMMALYGELAANRVAAA